MKVSAGWMRSAGTFLLVLGIEKYTNFMNVNHLLFLLLFSGVSHAQGFKATLSDLAFMAGQWEVKHAWGDMEEVWEKPMGNSMISTFRCVKDGKAVFYEFVIVEQEGPIPVMKLRHFNPGSIGWEEKNEPLSYPLVSLKDQRAMFEARDQSLRLIYEVDADKLDVILEEKNKKGEWEKVVFNFLRKKE